MEQECRLCRKSKKLAGSHIIPRMFFNEIKKASKTKGIREVSNPNKRLQDGLKVPFLCHECEELFSKYEKYFSDKYFQKTLKSCDDLVYDSNHDELRYFILSVAWRVLKLQCEEDKKMIESFTNEEKERLDNVLDEWRNILLNEDFLKMKNIQMHLIPTKNLEVFNNYPNMISNNTGMDFRVLGSENSFEYAYVYVKVPYFIMLCTVWGKTLNLKANIVGKKAIKSRQTTLPEWLNQLILYHMEQFKKSCENMSDRQIESIKKKANI